MLNGPYYELNDQGEIYHIRWEDEYKSHPKFVPYFELDETSYRICKSCGIGFDEESEEKRLLVMKSPGEIRNRRLELLHRGVCLECSGRINRRIAFTKNRDRLLDPEFKAQLDYRRPKGPNHPNWMGGKKFEPYCHLFNNEFKERVREFWGRKCGLCGLDEADNKLGRLAVHHVNYDKDTCCNANNPLFIPLCGSCHSRTNHNRSFWEDLFSNYIMIYFDGFCFLDKGCD